jgi:hypothetical protein
MSGFALGTVLGCLLGVVGTLLLLLLVYSIPDGEYLRSRISEPWRVVPASIVLIIACGCLFSFLPTRRVSFATTILLALVLITAHVSGMLASWITLSFASLALCLVLPPAQNLGVARPQDRMLLVFFVVCGAIGTRLVAKKQRA